MSKYLDQFKLNRLVLLFLDNYNRVPIDPEDVLWVSRMNKEYSYSSKKAMDIAAEQIKKIKKQKK
jgi:hypothetical protein